MLSLIQNFSNWSAKRIRKIARNAIINKYEQDKKDKNEKVSVWEIIDKAYSA